MRSLTATNARHDFFNIVKDAAQKHEIFHIHHRKGDVVLMSKEEYEGLIETLELLSTSGFKEEFDVAKEEIKAGETVTFDEVFGDSV